MLRIPPIDEMLLVAKRAARVLCALPMQILALRATRRELTVVGAIYIATLRGTPSCQCDGHAGC